MGLVERLTLGSTAGIDASVFVYHLEEHPVYIGLTNEILGAVESGRFRAVTSSLTLLETATRPYRLDQAWVARKYEALLANFPNLRIQAIDRDVARRAAQLRARFGLHPADALQAAACLWAGAEAIITNNRALECLQELCKVILLDDCL